MSDRYTYERQLENMRLWSLVCETKDPGLNTKRMEHGAKLTSIDQTYSFRRATEMWGPYGGSWGLFDLEWSYVTQGNLTLSLVLHAYFKYPDGQFPIASDIKWKDGHDCHKKLQTDATTKALAKLGFSADVFQGRFEDDKYATDEDRRQKVEEIIQVMRDAPTLGRLEELYNAAQQRGLNKFAQAELRTAYAELQKAFLDAEAEEAL